MKKLLAALLLIASTASANDCVPQTFTTLSKMVGEKRSYAEWRALTMPNGNSPAIMDAVRVWNSTQQYSRLYCTYSNLSDIPFKDDGVRFDVPYLWVGRMPAGTVENQNSDYAHCAIVIFTEAGNFIIHSLGNGRIFRERISTEEFFRRTYCVFKVDHLVEFIHFETTGEVVIIDRRN